MKNIFLLAILFLVSSILSGQNYFFDEGKPGAHIAGSFGSLDGQLFYGIFPGFTIKDKISLEFGMTTLTSNVGRNQSALSVSLSALITKQSEDSPISFGINLAYQNHIVFGPTIHHQITLEKVAIIPSIGYFFLNTIGDQRNNLLYNYALFAVALKLNKFYVEPTLTHSSVGTLFSTTVGLLFNI